MHEERCGVKTAEGQGWSIGKFREKVLRAVCRVAWHARMMLFHIAQSVAEYWWKLLEVW